MANPYDKSRPKTKKEVTAARRNLKKLNSRKDVLKQKGIIGEITRGPDKKAFVEVAVKSSFYSEDQIVARVLENAMRIPEPCKTLTTEEIIEQTPDSEFKKPLDNCAKARMLAYKYKKYSRTLASIYHNSRFKKLSELQCQFVFDIVSQLKEKWEENGGGDATA